MAMFQIYALDEQTKILPIVDTASGSIASFDTDLTENLIEVKCQIVAKQEGSDTPSPDNERPIQTYTEMNLYQYGSNYIDESDIVQGGFNVNNGGDYANTTRTRTQTHIAIPQGTYTIFNVEKYEYVVYVYDENNVFIDGESIKSWQSYGTPFTVGANRHIRIGWRKPDNSTMYPSDIHDAVCASTANGTTENISFGQTVAGGVFDLTTGKLLVTHGIVDMGTLNFSQGFSGFYTANIRDNIEVPTSVSESQLVSSIFSVGNQADADQMYIQFHQSYLGLVVFLPSTSYATASDFKTAMNGIPLVYKLATPQEIQLDSTQITALLNENNIWCDTGDTSVKYLLTVGKKIA